MDLTHQTSHKKPSQLLAQWSLVLQVDLAAWCIWKHGCCFAQTVLLHSVLHQTPFWSRALEGEHIKKHLAWAARGMIGWILIGRKSYILQLGWVARPKTHGAHSKTGQQWMPLLDWNMMECLLKWTKSEILCGRLFSTSWGCRGTHNWAKWASTRAATGGGWHSDMLCWHVFQNIEWNTSHM